MTHRFEQLPVLIGDPVASDEPITRLYDKQETHQGSTPRFLWPGLNNNRPEAKDFTTGIQRPVWIEFGFGPQSLLPFATNVQRVIAIDDRAWAFNLFEFDNRQEAIEVYRNLQNKIPLMMEIPIFLRLKHMAGKIKDARQAGIALFLLSRIGGNTKHFKSFDASISGFDQTGQAGCVPIRSIPIVGTIISKKVSDALKTSVHVTQNFSDQIHLHFNLPPSVDQDESKSMLYHLNKLGYSWTMMGESKKQLTKLSVGNVLQLDKDHFLSSERR